MDKRLAKSFIHRFVEKYFLVFGILFNMRFNIPKNDSRYHWTQHSIRKMLFYGLTEDRVKRIIRNPKRVENGVAKNTIAVMSSVGESASGGKPTNKNKPTEIWVMYATAKPQVKSEKLEVKSFGKKIIISAWRYPGISPVGKQIPIPVDILAELKEDGIIE